MANKLPIPECHWPHTVADFMSLGRRLGGTARLLVGPKVRRRVRDGKRAVEKEAPSFVEYWIEWPQAGAPGPAQVDAPEDPLVRAFLEGTAKLAAKAWLDEARGAKGWHGEWVDYEPEPPEGT
ncbi:MAG TPA: hypothetical protein VEB43_04640 [Anaeromyxobacter sp.]|nr:hypothetical protein [Anaeromyxobacter sp.]